MIVNVCKVNPEGSPEDFMPICDLEIIFMRYKAFERVKVEHLLNLKVRYVVDKRGDLTLISHIAFKEKEQESLAKRLCSEP